MRTSSERKSCEVKVFPR